MNAELDYTPSVIANLGVPVRLYVEPPGDEGPEPEMETVRLRFTVNRLALLEERFAAYRYEVPAQRTITHHVRDDSGRVTGSTIEEEQRPRTEVAYGEDAIVEMRQRESWPCARALVAIAHLGRSGSDVEAEIGERMVPMFGVDLYIDSALGALQMALGVDPTLVSTALRGISDVGTGLVGVLNEALGYVAEGYRKMGAQATAEAEAAALRSASKAGSPEASGPG